MSITESPRTVTRGQSVQPPGDQRALVDWLQVTFHGKISLAEIKALFGLSGLEMFEAERAWNGYHHMVQMDGINIMWRSGGMEWHVLMSGTGCRLWEQVTEYADKWETLLEKMDEFTRDPKTGEHLGERWFKFTRLDLAIDDFQGLLKIGTLKGKIRSSYVVSKFKRAEIYEGYRLSTEAGKEGNMLSDGITMGSRTSRVMLRVYDKKIERESKGYEVTEDSWIRTELQFRDEYAHEIAQELMRHHWQVGLVVKRILMEYVKFVNKTGNDSNKRRWKTSPFWEKFLGAVTPLKLSLQAPDQTADTVMSWLEKQAAPSVSMLLDALGEKHFYGWLEDVKENGLDRRKKKHEAMIRQFHEINGTPEKETPEEKAKRRKEKAASALKKLSDQDRQAYKNAVMSQYNTKSHEQYMRQKEQDRIRKGAKFEEEE